jgi:hypothetical protein
MNTVRWILYLLALAAPGQAALELNTCDGAYNRYMELSNTCPTTSPGPGCRNDACKAAISSIDDTTLSSMKTGFKACGNLPASDTTGFDYQYLLSIATQCAHPASTVKVTPPALNTCDGAYTRIAIVFANACPGPWTPASCGNTACATAISSIDDTTLSLMKTGFWACRDLPASDKTESARGYVTSVNYQYLISAATQCGHPASTVKLTPSFATHGAYVPGGFIHAVLCVVTLMVSSLGMKKY